MSIEDRLSEALARNLDQLEVPAGDVGAALRAGERQRRQRTWTTGLAAAAVLAVVATGVVVARSGDDGGRLDPAPPTGSWTRLPDAPLSPRTGGIAVWTGTEAIFLGGEIDNLCPPNADCAEMPTYAKDGAAYDPASQTWRKIAAAPVAVRSYTPHAMAGTTLVIVADSGTWHAYDATADHWRVLRPGSVEPSSWRLSAAGDRVYALGQDGVVQALDLGTDQWSALPASTHEPHIHPVDVLATPEGIVVVGLDSTEPNDGVEPSYLLAEVYDGSGWRRLERSDMVIGSDWQWTGERLVAPYTECVDGGEVNGYGRCIPQGGILDPGAGTWAELPKAPEPGAGAWGFNAEGSGPLMATRGQVYDDSSGNWTTLARPNGAPDYSISAIWAGNTLIAFGGLDSEQGWDKDALSNKAWSWTP